MPTTNETAAQGGLGRQLPDDDTGKPIVHSGRLIYAKPRDLPSYPSIGLSEKGSAASAAAALGWVANTSPALWKPDKSAPASAAAVMAKDYKLSPAWEPAPSPHGTKAALLASQSAMNATGVSKPATSDSGHSAANIAFKSDRSIPHTHTNSLERQRSLLAAKGAMANRQRAKSSPIPRESYPDEANAAANALSAATRAHRPAQSPTISEMSDKAGSVPYTSMSRQMFTSRPPVQPEVDEQKRADVLHASAVAMAKKMYNQQQKMINARKAHDNATLSEDQPDVLSSVSDDAQPVQLTTLQDAAYKQAQARLAKMHEEHFKNKEYQEYYGAHPLARRFSIRGKLRKRASSDGDVIEDRRRSQQIRQQMSLFSNKISEIDDRKRQHDQEVLLAAAQRNVHERLKGMDEKISAETGMVPPSTPTQWELKAHAIAQAKSEQRMGRGFGKVDIGAGKFMTQEEIDAIAAARVKPVLDEINERVEEEQARQMELRLEMEKRKEEEEIEKARQREIQDISKRLKEQDKLEQEKRRAEEKQEAKARKEEDRAAKAEQKRLAKAEKRRSRASTIASRHGETHDEPEPVRATVVMNSAGQPVSLPPPDPAPTATATNDTTTAADGADEAAFTPTRDPGAPGEPGPSRTAGVKSWFKNRFSRASRPFAADDHDNNHNNNNNNHGNNGSNSGKLSKGKAPERGFIGGAALAGLIDSPGTSTRTDTRSASVRAVAMAGRGGAGLGSGSVSSDSDDDDDDDGVDVDVDVDDDENENDEDGDGSGETRDRPRTALTPPRPVRAREFGEGVRQSPNRDSRFVEMV